MTHTLYLSHSNESWALDSIVLSTAPCMLLAQLVHIECASLPDRARIHNIARRRIAHLIRCTGIDCKVSSASHDTFGTRVFYISFGSSIGGFFTHTRATFEGVLAASRAELVALRYADAALARVLRQQCGCAIITATGWLIDNSTDEEIDLREEWIVTDE